MGRNLILLMSGLINHGQADLYPQEKSNPLLRLEDDFADSELAYFVFRGAIVITTERPKLVRKRLKSHFVGLLEIKKQNPKWLPYITPSPLEIVRGGKTVCIDFENSSYEEISTDCL